MKHFLLSLLILSFLSCKNEEKKDVLYPESGTETTTEGETANLTPSQAKGKEIFEGAGNCFSCHKAGQKAIGPNITEIAAIYKKQNGDIPAFLRGKAEPIVDPSQYEVMKTNFYITKNMSDEELNAIRDYMMSHLAP